MKSSEIPVQGSLVLQTFKMVAVAMIFTLIALLILALFVTYGNMSDKAVLICVEAATFICVFLAGFAVSGAVGKNGWLSGLVAGVVYVIVILIVGWISLGDSSITNETSKMFIISIVSGIIGGITGVNFKNKRRLRR